MKDIKVRRQERSSTVKIESKEFIKANLYHLHKLKPKKRESIFCSQTGLQTSELTKSDLKHLQGGTDWTLLSGLNIHKTIRERMSAISVSGYCVGLLGSFLKQKSCDSDTTHNFLVLSNMPMIYHTSKKNNKIKHSKHGLYLLCHKWNENDQVQCPF